MNTALVFYTPLTKRYMVIYAGQAIRVNYLETVVMYCKRNHIGVRMQYF